MVGADMQGHHQPIGRSVRVPSVVCDCLVRFRGLVYLMGLVALSQWPCVAGASGPGLFNS